MHPRALDRLAGGQRALGERRSELGPYDADEDIELEVVRRQQGVGAAFGALSQQLKQPVLVAGHQVHPAARIGLSYSQRRRTAVRSPSRPPHMAEEAIREALLPARTIEH